MRACVVLLQGGRNEEKRKLQKKYEVKKRTEEGGRDEDGGIPK